MERLCDLNKKEVIDVADGRRLGFINDCELDIYTGQLISIIVPKSGGFWSKEDYVIPWKHIKRIGDDIVIVDTRREINHREDIPAS
ncbi:MAG: YlmC/YmxH family sporulation protein [Clostridiales bacterium]|jgi:YlmC/YmxH family sporulation protein|nr:YlmC/YmxH family sporulation protein [Clostridiales bacterium]